VRAFAAGLCILASCFSSCIPASSALPARGSSFPSSGAQDLNIPMTLAFSCHAAGGIH
jgi:hypothetical protein